ncbi:MAG: hypothetical protein PQJ49_03090 [Sphaerochaetaceae bacterium]|nr:hypothetical protein [Sphaerochaetaceae bacterium]MDC7236922.1 hypothetical protein [Sphaerochaetaceae bacterium]MDC7248885.1 hypothetical protein [Sphaerochaetaceae bacterium]
MIDIYQDVFDKTYQTILVALENRSKKADFSIQNIKGELLSFYRYDGLDWTGRGETKQAENDGAILAYEVFIERYEKEHSTNN